MPPTRPMPSAAAPRTTDPDAHGAAGGRAGAVADAVDTRPTRSRGTTQPAAAGRGAPEKELSDGMGHKEAAG